MDRIIIVLTIINKNDTYTFFYRMDIISPIKLRIYFLIDNIV